MVHSQKRVFHPGLVQNVDRGANGFNGLHPRRQDHRLALARDVTDQRQVVSLARADLVGRHVLRFQPIRRSARKRRGNPDQPQAFGIALQLGLFLQLQRAAFHHMPDRHIGVRREDRLRLIRHLVFDDMGLMLDHLAARPGRQPHHFLGHAKVATMVDADLGNDQGRVVRADLAVGNLHLATPSLRSVLHEQPRPVKPADSGPEPDSTGPWPQGGFARGPAPPPTRDRCETPPPWQPPVPA